MALLGDKKIIILDEPTEYIMLEIKIFLRIT